MTLVKARAAFETAIKNAVSNADPTVDIIFDNVPFSTPGSDKKYVMVSLDFTQSTTQPQGSAQTYYSGSISCGVMTPKNTGTESASAVAESVIVGLTSVNAPNYVDTFSVSPRVSQLSGPTTVNNEQDSHFLSAITCTFTANG